MKWAKIISLSFVFLSLTLSLYSCRNPEITSARRDRVIKIDGNDEDWRGISSYYNDKDHLRVSLLNDERYLYISITAPGHKMKHHLMSGFTLWFDATGGTEQTFGVRVALAEVVPQSFRDRPPVGNENLPSPDTGMARRLSPEIHVIGPNDQLLYDCSKQGMPFKVLEAMMGSFPSREVFEFKVPLFKNDKTPYAIGIRQLPSTISIEFTTEMRAGGSEKSEGPKDTRSEFAYSDGIESWRASLDDDMGSSRRPSHSRGLSDGHRVGRCRRLKTNAKEDNLARRIFARNLERV